MAAKYTYIKFLVLQLYFILLSRLGWAHYIIPDLKFEAFDPKGFRVSIPHDDKLQLFAFHGRINGMLSELEPGELTQDVRKATNGKWVYENPDVELHVGDYIGYWVFVQNSYLGYRKDNQTWEVKALVPKNCELSQTLVNGKSACKGDLIFEDSFINPLNPLNWLVEQYYPAHSPHFEYNYYSPTTVKVEDLHLKITPIPKQNEEDIRGILDLRSGCTKHDPEECYYQQIGAQYLPPVASGSMKSKFLFTYGRVEIEAKLPCGDWIFPEISIIPKNKENSADQPKIVIAYSRGNSVLLSEDHEDIGSRLLFSGYTTTSREPEHSRKLASKRGEAPFCNQMHKYTLVWRPDDIVSYFDRELIPYGDIHIDGSPGFKGQEGFINLAVMIGGITDFPDNYTTTDGRRKPWMNNRVDQLRTFFTARNEWKPTWQGNSLEVKSVKIYAL